MWIFANDSFLSVVRDREKPGRLLIRARRSGDIERLFPGADVIESREADYRFRTFVPEEAVVEAVAARFRAIDYGNFKDSIEDRDLSAFAHRVWLEGLQLQKADD